MVLDMLRMSQLWTGLLWCTRFFTYRKRVLKLNTMRSSFVIDEVTEIEQRARPNPDYITNRHP